MSGKLHVCSFAFRIVGLRVSVMYLVGLAASWWKDSAIDLH